MRKKIFNEERYLEVNKAYNEINEKLQKVREQESGISREKKVLKRVVSVNTMGSFGLNTNYQKSVAEQVRCLKIERDDLSSRVDKSSRDRIQLNISINKERVKQDKIHSKIMNAKEKGNIQKMTELELNNKERTVEKKRDEVTQLLLEGSHLKRDLSQKVTKIEDGNSKLREEIRTI